MPQVFDVTELTQKKKNVLVFGPPKTGKTRFAATAPKPIRLYDLDLGALSVAKDHKPGEISVVRFAKTSADKVGLTQERSRQRAVLTEFIQDFNSLFDLPADKLPKTVVIDSLTELGNLVMEFVLDWNGRNAPLFPDWGQAAEKLKEFVRAGLSLPCNFILVAHEKLDKDETLGQIQVAPMIFGQLAGEIGRFFDDVFYSRMEKDKDGNMIPMLLTCGDGLVKSPGTRSQLLPKLVPPVWRGIYGD